MYPYFCAVSFPSWSQSRLDYVRIWRYCKVPGMYTHTNTSHVHVYMPYTYIAFTLIASTNWLCMNLEIFSNKCYTYTHTHQKCMYIIPVCICINIIHGFICIHVIYLYISIHLYIWHMSIHIYKCICIAYVQHTTW